jgi:hypothetical protein
VAGALGTPVGRASIWSWISSPVSRTIHQPAPTHPHSMTTTTRPMIKAILPPRPFFGGTAPGYGWPGTGWPYGGWP